MKRVVSVMLMITIILSSTMSVFALEKSTDSKGEKIDFTTVYKYVDKETGFEEEIIQINGKKMYYYYCNSGSDVVSIYIKNNELQDYATRDQEGNVYTLPDSKVTLSSIGVKQAKQLEKINTKELLDYMHQITDGMKKNKDYLECVDIISPVEKTVTRMSSSTTISNINTKIHSMGYRDFDYKVVANIPYNGVPGQVNERGTIVNTSKENIYLAEINTPITLVTVALALTYGDVVSIGVWIIDYVMGVISAHNQEFQTWKSKWVGSKYVSFYGQGNYWQVEKVALFTSTVGEVGFLVDNPNVSADAYYDNHAKLIENGYIFNY